MWMILDKNSDISLKRQIYNQLKNRILNGTLHSNEKLPSTRTLADELSVSRNTILEVYSQLIAEGYLNGSHGSGTFVAEGIPQFNNDSVHHNPELLTPDTSQKNQIDFRSGVPDLALFPRKEWAKLYYNRINDLPSTSLRYYNPGGVMELRNAISQYLFRIRGINCSPENIMIVSGSTQGLSLISKLLYQDNQNVIVENPMHPGLVNVIASAGYNIQGIEADEKGLQVSNLKPSNNISFVYTTPSHQYPLGSILPIQRRLSLIQYAQENNCYIVEDDYDSEFRFEGQPIHSLYELNPTKVIYLGSFSKILAPAIRLGFLILPDTLLNNYKRLKMYADVHTEALSQYVLAEFIHHGGLEKHIWKMKKVYNRKRIHLIKELNKNLNGEFEIKGQAAGLHILVTFYHIIFTEELVAKILSANVKIYPVQNFMLPNSENNNQSHDNQIILGYAHLSLTEITNGIRILSNILKSEPEK